MRLLSITLTLLEFFIADSLAIVVRLNSSRHILLVFEGQFTILLLEVAMHLIDEAILCPKSILIFQSLDHLLRIGIYILLL
jgi:hypothetical protein